MILLQEAPQQCRQQTMLVLDETYRHYLSPISSPGAFHGVNDLWVNKE